MPPKRKEAGGGGAPAKVARAGNKEVLDYPRPFFQRSLTRAEIQEDLALIQSSFKREHRAPARYGAGSRDREREREDTPGNTREAPRPRQMQVQPHPQIMSNVSGMPVTAYPAGYHPGPMRPAPPVVYQPVVLHSAHPRYVVGS